MIPPKSCMLCRHEFLPSKERQRFCSRLCAHTYSSRLQAARKKAQRIFVVCKRAECKNEFWRRTLTQVYCSVRCSGLERVRSINPIPRPTRPASDMVFEPQASPKCETCGGVVKFGSDPRNGTSTVWCCHCGERPLPRHGVVKYPQREDLEKEMGASVTTAHRKPDSRHRTASPVRIRKAEGFRVIGRDMQRKIEAA